MLAAGWVEEVRQLRERGFAGTRPFASVGYKQISLALDSAQPMNSAELELSIFRATRIFARRQRTWLRDQPIEWLALGSSNWLQCAESVPVLARLGSNSRRVSVQIRHT